MRQLISQMLEAMEVWSDARLSAQGQKAITAAREYLAQPEQSEPDWKKPPEYVPPLVKWAQEQTAPPLRELSDDQLWKIWDEFYIDTPSYDRPSFELTLYRAVLAAARSSK